MKKVITIGLFVFAMLASTETIMAQNKIEINAAAAEKVEVLHSSIKFDNDQKEEIYQAFKTYYTAQANLKKSTHVDPLTIEKTNAVLENTLKNALTEEQFEIYASLPKDK